MHFFEEAHKLRSQLEAVSDPPLLDPDLTADLAVRMFGGPLGLDSERERVFRGEARRLVQELRADGSEDDLPLEKHLRERQVVEALAELAAEEAGSGEAEVQSRRLAQAVEALAMRPVHRYSVAGSAHAAEVALGHWGSILRLDTYQAKWAESIAAAYAADVLEAVDAGARAESPSSEVEAAIIARQVRAERELLAHLEPDQQAAFRNSAPIILSFRLAR